MAKPRQLDVIDTLGQAISNAINAANIPNDDGIAPGQTVAGWAVTTELTKILALGGMNHLVVLWPLTESDDTIWAPDDQPRTVPPTTPTLTATITDLVITFAGTSQPCNVHVVIDNKLDALVQPTTGESLDDIATATATAINAKAVELGIAGDVWGTSDTWGDGHVWGRIYATAAGATVTISGASSVICNIGAVGTQYREIARIKHVIQATIYTPNPLARALIGSAIRQAIGTSDTHYYTLDDGEQVFVKIGPGSRYVEKAQSSYSAFEYHLFFQTSYPITDPADVTQIGAIEFTRTIKQQPPVTAVYGGS